MHVQISVMRTMGIYKGQECLVDADVAEKMISSGVAMRLSDYKATRGSSGRRGPGRPPNKS